MYIIIYYDYGMLVPYKQLDLFLSRNTIWNIYSIKSTHNK